MRHSTLAVTRLGKLDLLGLALGVPLLLFVVVSPPALIVNTGALIVGLAYASAAILKNPSAIFSSIAAWDLQWRAIRSLLLGMALIHFSLPFGFLFGYPDRDAGDAVMFGLVLFAIAFIAYAQWLTISDGYLEALREDRA